MAFRLKAGVPLDKNIRRIVKDQIDKSLDALNVSGDDETESAIHEARRHFKKIRAAIRLVRDGLGRKVYHDEKDRFRDAGRPLSEVRDAEVLVRAFDALIERSDASGAGEAVGMIRSALSDRRREARRRVLDKEQALAAVAKCVRKARRGVKRWKLDGNDWSILAAGLSRIYRRGYRASTTASDDPTDENWHEWRKQVKDLHYALELLQPIRPEPIREQSESASKLADALGDDHDLAVLNRVLADRGVATEGGADLGTIPTMIGVRRADLQRDARALGRIVYREKPKAFVRRLKGYRQAWESGQADTKHG